MSAAIFALVAGTILAIGALAFVLYPLFFETHPTLAVRTPGPRAWSDDIAVAALREIEFDRATGKLSDADYVQLKAHYTRQALASMRHAPESPAEDRPTPADDDV